MRTRAGPDPAESGGERFTRFICAVRHWFGGLMLACLAVAVSPLAQAAPADQDVQAIDPEIGVPVPRCGRYAVAVKTDDPLMHDMPPRHAALSLTDDAGRVAYRSHAARIEVLHCVETLGATDLGPALLVMSRSAVDGCCNSFRFLSLGRRVGVLLNWEAGQASELEYQPDGRLVGNDDRLREFGGLPPALGPLIPLAFCPDVSRRRYHDCSGALMARDALLEQLGLDVEKLPAEAHSDRRKAEGLRILAMASRAGAAQMVLSWIGETAPDVAAWLTPRLPRLEACLIQSATASREVRARACRQSP